MNSEYEVGFCRPPKATRFKPGQSGNPVGRPKGVMNIDTLIDAIINKKVVATVDGKEMKLSKKHVMWLRVANDAVGGKLASLKILERRMDRIDEKKAVQAAAKEQSMAPTDREILDHYFKGDNDGRTEKTECDIADGVQTVCPQSV